MAEGVLAGYSAAFIVLVLGLIIAFKPQWYIRLIKWQMEKLWAAKFIPSKKTEERMRVMGAFLLLIAVIILSSVYFFAE